MVVQLCESLDIPLRDRNDLLRSAGYAAIYPENQFDGAALEPFRQIIAQLLKNHEPYPAFVMGRYWNVVDANSAGRLMLPVVEGRTANAVDLFLVPGSWRDSIENFAEVATVFVSRLRREVAESGGDERLAAMLQQTLELLDGVPLQPNCDAEELVVCPRLNINGRIVRTVSAIAQFGSARDVTLSELRVEFLCPGDRDSAEFFQSMSAAAQ